LIGNVRQLISTVAQRRKLIVKELLLWWPEWTLAWFWCRW